MTQILPAAAPLDPSFLTVPLAHRAMHDLAQGRQENSLAAAQAAVDHGYGLEIDLQLSADGIAMVFHDYELDRLTNATGPLGTRTAHELGQAMLKTGNEGIPTLAQLLRVVAGKVPLLIEIKDQDGAMGPNTGQIERATAADLQHYKGPVAVMSYNPHSVAAMRLAAPDVVCGLTTSPFEPKIWTHLAAPIRDRLRAIPDFANVGASFISHAHYDLGAAPVTALRAAGVPVLCWTIRSAAEAAATNGKADNITFEGYLP